MSARFCRSVILLIAVFFLSPVRAAVDTNEFRRQIQATTYMRGLLLNTNAVTARAYLGLVGSAGGATNEVTYRANLTELRNTPILDGFQVLGGYYREGDGGGGIFVLTNTVTSTNRGTRFEVPGTGFSYERIHNGVLDVRAFGAKIDGSTVNTSANQAAIDFCSANEYTLYFPAGTNLTLTLNLANNSRIIGAGSRSVLAGSAADVVLLASGKTNVTLQDFTIGGTSGVGVFSENCRDFTLRNIFQTGAILHPNNYTAGIEIEAANNVLLDNVKQWGNGINVQTNNADYNLLIGFFNSISTNVTIQNHHIDNLYSDFGIAAFNVDNLKIAHGFIDMAGIGTTNNADGYAVVCYGKTGVSISHRPTVDDITITNCYGTGILFRNVEDGVIQNCHLSRVSQQCLDTDLGQGGISVTKGIRVNVIGNTITDSGINSGIQIDSSTNCVIARNPISLPGTNHFGIELRGENLGTAIFGNTIDDSHRGIGTSLGNGVLTAADIGPNVIRNTIDGIYFTGASSNNAVHDNRILSNFGTAITDQGSYDTFDNNKLIDGTLGLYLIGTNGIVNGNLISGQTTGINVSGAGYRVGNDNQFYNNDTPIQDTAGVLVRVLTSGRNPNVRDTQVFRFNYSVVTSITNFAGGTPGDIRIFTSGNTNVTIVHSMSIQLDGASDFNMKLGDSLTLYRDDAGAWRQIGKSINSNWTQLDRATGNLIVNAPTYFRGLLSSSTTASTFDFPIDIAVGTALPNARLIRAFSLASPVNGWAIEHSADGSNIVETLNGIKYLWPWTNGLSGQVFAIDGGNPQTVYFTNSTGAGENNTASNLGTQSATVQGLWNTKSGVDLRFRSLQSGTQILFTSNATTVSISAVAQLPLAVSDQFTFGSSSNLALGPSTSFTNMTAAGTFTVSGNTASKIVRTDGSKQLADVTVSGDLSFDGSTLTHTAPNLLNSGTTNAQLNGNFSANAETITNGVTVLDVTASKLVRTDSAQKLAVVTVGGDLSFDGTTLTHTASTVLNSGTTNAQVNGNFAANAAALTNGLTLYDVTASTLLRADASKKVASVTAGNNIYFDGTTLTAATNNWFNNGSTNSYLIGNVAANSATFTNGITLPNVGASKIVVTDASKITAAATIGAGLTFATGTLATSDNLYGSGTTNAAIDGNLTASKIISTNGFFTGSASYTPTAVSPINSGGDTPIGNTSSTRLSTTTISGGAGAETWLAFKSGNANAGIFDTNQTLEVFAGTSSAHSTVTNYARVSAGTSSSFARIGGTIKVSTTQAGNVGGGEDNLITYSLPSGVLATNLDTIEIRASGSFAANGNTKTVKAYFGTQVVFDSTAIAFNAGDYVLTIEVIRTGAATQIANATWTSSNTNLTSSALISSPTETLSGTVTIKLTGTGTSDNDVTQKTLLVNYQPAP